MNSLWQFLQQRPLSTAIGWTILHSIWQGAIIGMVFAVCQYSLRKRSAQARYLAGCCALAAIICVAAFTFAHALGKPGAVIESARPALSSSVRMSVSTSRSFGVDLPPVLQSGGRLAQAIPLVTAAWLIGVFLLSLRLAKNGWWVRRLRVRGHSPVEQSVLELLADLCCRLEISRPVKAVESALVQVPSVIGWLRPVILLPASVLSGLAPAELETILAHELAHVKRHDYLVNLFQCALETIMFYHPVVWWISRCVRDERERCCDDLVVKVCGSPMTYARALVSLEESRAEIREFALAATGGDSLLNRVRRLMGLSETNTPSAGRQSAGFALITLGLALLAIGLLQYNEKPQYRSFTRIKLAANGPAAYDDPYLVKSVVEWLQSETILAKAIADAKSSLSTGELRGRLRLKPYRNTSILEIGVFGDTPKEAMDLANAVTHAYMAALPKPEEEFERVLKAHEEKVAAQEKVLEDLRVKLTVPDSIAYGDGSWHSVSSRLFDKFEELRIKNENQYVQEKTVYKTLSGLPKEQLEQVIPTIYPDDLLTSLLEQRSLAEQKLIQIKDELGQQRPEYTRTTQTIEGLNNKIDRRVEGIMFGLGERVKSLKTTLDQTVTAAEDARADALRISPYLDARQKLEESRRYYEVATAQVASGRVEILETHLGSRPVSPNRPRAGAMMLMGTMSLLTGLFLAKSRSLPDPVLHAA